MKTTDHDGGSGFLGAPESAVAALPEGAPFVDIAFSPNGPWAVTVSTTEVLYVWNVSNHFAGALCARRRLRYSTITPRQG